MTPKELDKIKARRAAITMGDGDWHRMKHEDGSLMADYISAGQSKNGYSLDVIISETAKPENMEFIVHCPIDIDDCLDEIEQLKTACRMAYQGLCTYDDEAAQKAIAFIDTLETAP